MSIKLDGYCLYEFMDTRGDAVYLLTRAIRPDYPISLWTAENWAGEVYTRSKKKLVQQFIRSPFAQGLLPVRQIGEWLGGVTESNVLDNAKPFSVHQLWYSFDMHYPGLFGFEICETEDAFWRSMRQCRLEGIYVDDLARPANRIAAYFLADDTYAEGAFPYHHLGEHGWTKISENESRPARRSQLPTAGSRQRISSLTPMSNRALLSIISTQENQ